MDTWRRFELRHIPYIVFLLLTAFKFPSLANSSTTRYELTSLSEIILLAGPAKTLLIENKPKINTSAKFLEIYGPDSISFIQNLITNYIKMFQ